MTINSYNTLTATALDWLADQAITAAQMETMVQLAERRIYRGSQISTRISQARTIDIKPLRIRAMENSLSSTISGGVVALPTGYLSLKAAQITPSSGTFQELKRLPLNVLYRLYPSRGSVGLPHYIARDGTNFVFGPAPDSDYLVTGTYYAELDPLSSTSTNWFTDNAADVLLFAVMVEANLFVRDDEAVLIWASRLQEAIATLQKQDDAENMSGSRIQAVRA